MFRKSMCVVACAGSVVACGGPITWSEALDIASASSYPTAAPLAPQAFEVDLTRLHDAPAVRTPMTAQDTGLAYTTTEPFARYVIETDAPSVEVSAMQDTLSTPGGANSVGIAVNGEPQGDGSDLGVDLGVVKTMTYQLPGGTNTVELLAGMNYRRSDGTFGATPNLSYQIPGGYFADVIAPTRPAKRILLVTDSIFLGPYTDAGPHQAGVFQSVAMLIRRNALASKSGPFAGASVTAAGADGMQLQNIAYNPAIDPATAQTVSRWKVELDGTVANEIVLAIGTNDYGGASGLQGAATFQAQLEGLLDAEHAALPSVPVLLVTQLNRGDETPNRTGATLEAFRAVERTVQAARSAFVSIKEGPGIVAAFSDYHCDQLHLNTHGMAMLEAGLRSAIGY